jgi:hypothetical protein
MQATTEQTIQEKNSQSFSQNLNGSVSTTMESQVAEELATNDATPIDARFARFNWLADRMPDAEYLTFPGGLMSKCLFEEARHSFLHGRFLATIVLGFAFVERTLAALFQVHGLDRSEQESLGQLLCKARRMEWISHQEWEALERARGIPNPEAHFRRLPYRDSIEYQSIVTEGVPYTVIEQDAEYMITVVMNLLAKQSVTNH